VAALPTESTKPGEAMAGIRIILQAGHDRSYALPMVVFRAVYTETNARLQGQAAGLGGEITFLDEEEGEKAMRVLDQIHLRAWELWKRKATQ
jgi:hypothetical protein